MKLQNSKHQPSTKSTYLSVWRKFNKFVIRLDSIPKRWEERVSLYIAYLFDQGAKSTTIRSYISGIKSILKDDGYDWSDPKLEFAALTSACKLINDRVKTRLPITLGLLEILLKHIQSYFEKRGQVYLIKLYQCLFLLAYYGLLRIGEMATGTHPIKAKDMHVGKNKRKIMAILFSSKTHGVHSSPQEIRIWADHELSHVKFCPFAIAQDFGRLRGGYTSDDDPFFVFQDGTAVKPVNVRGILRKMLKKMGLNSKLYDTHSFRIGRASDLMKNGYSIDRIKQLGRWKSNAVFKYIRSN